MTDAQRTACLKRWHQEVCKRDKYTCTYCGTCYDYEGGRNMVAGDHIECRRPAPELIFDVTNGRCTCNKAGKLCHNKRHDGTYSPYLSMKQNQKREAEKKERAPKKKFCEYKGHRCPLMPLGNGRCVQHQ